jgi:GH24 family phage-related lysozyme (muramidase)
MLWCIVYIASLITCLVSAPEEIEKDKVGEPEPMALESSAPPLAPALVTAVKQFEGCSPRAFWDYRQYSIGYGTRALSPDEMIDCETEAEQRLIVELGQAQMQVDAFGAPLTAAQRAALTSLTFNAGASWMQSGLGEAVRAGNWIRARAIFLDYVHAKGEVLDGLVRRRRAEAAWFEGELIAAIAEQAPAGEPKPPAAARKVRVAANVDGDNDRPRQIVKKEQVKVASRDDDDDDRQRRRRQRHRDDGDNNEND